MADLDPAGAGVVTGPAPAVAFGSGLGCHHRTDPIGGLGPWPKQQVPHLAEVVLGHYATGSQTAQAIPLVLGLVDSNRQDSVRAALVADVRTQGLTAGDIGHRYLLRALADMERSDVIFALHSQTNKPGYGFILNRGATALTEGWDGSSSQSHFMLGHIMEWFYHDLAGIQPGAPGFKEIVIKPTIVGDLTWVKASYNSIHGPIVSECP